MDVVFPIEGVTSEEQLLEAIETGPDGFFPVGGNDFWHGGVHLRTNKPLVAIRDGELVAYRINQVPLVAQVGEARMEYSSGFVLLRHRVETPLGHEHPATFYSLVMHVLPWLTYRNDPSLTPPRFLAERRPKKIITDRDGRGVRMLGDSSPATVLGVIPQGALICQVPGDVPATHWSKTREYPGFVKVRWNELVGWVKLGPSNSHQERTPTQWIATSPIPVGRPNNPSQRAGEIPANALFNAIHESPTDESWRSHPRRGALFKVVYGAVQGYADLKDSDLKDVALAASIQITGDNDVPVEPSKLGLAVRARGESSAPVLRILPKGTSARFKDPFAVKRMDARYHELEDGGFILVDDRTMEMDWAIKEPAKFDEVVIPGRTDNAKIERGHPLGYAGTYLRSLSGEPTTRSPSADNVVHFEIFSPDTGLANNPHNEHWFGTKFKIQPNTVFKRRECAPGSPPPRATVDIRAGDTLRFVRKNTGSRYERCFRHEVVGWTRLRELGEEFVQGYTVRESLDPLLENPPTCWCSESGAGSVRLEASRGQYLDGVQTVLVREPFKLVRYLKPGSTSRATVDGWAREHELGDFYEQAHGPTAATPSAVAPRPVNWTTPSVAANLVVIPMGCYVRHDESQQVSEVFRKVILNTETGWAPKTLLGNLDPDKHVYAPAVPVPFLRTLPTTREEMRSGRSVPAGSELKDAGEEATANEPWVHVAFRNTDRVEVTAWVRAAELGPVLENRFVLTTALDHLVTGKPSNELSTEGDNRLGINIPAGSMLEFRGESTLATREYTQVKLHGTERVGWKQTRALNQNATRAPHHVRLSADLSGLLLKAPRQTEFSASAGTEVTVLAEETVAGTAYLQISHGGKNGWWPKAELGGVTGHRCVLAAELRWVLRDKPTESAMEALKITAKSGDAVVVHQQVGVFVKVEVVVTLDEERCHGWYATADFHGTWNNRTLTRSLTEVATDDPESVFTVDAGVNPDVIEFEATTEPAVRTQRGEGWHEVEFKPGDRGWINIHVDSATRKFVNPKVVATSTYDWAEWQQLQEEGAEAHFSDDGLCDVPALVSLLEKDERGTKRDSESSTGVVTIKAIKQALADTRVRKKLRSLVCLHPSEWDSGGDWDKRFSRLKEAPWHLDGSEYNATLDYIKKLEFWRDAFGRDGTAASSKVWHWHPINILSQWRRMRGLTADQIKRIFPAAQDTNIHRYIEWLNVAMERYEINTPLLQAHFLAQLGHESGQLRYATEEASGRDYEARFDLDNVRPGDGSLFKGRGLIQLTGRANYSLYGAFIGEDLTGEPARLAAEPRLACDVSGWFWRYNGSNKDLNTIAIHADDKTVEAVTRVVNGGKLGLAQRVELFHNAKSVLLDWG